MKRSFDVSFDDTKIIRDFEGFSLTAYPDPVSKGDPYTIAWGLTGEWVIPGLIITEEEAQQRFMSRIAQYCTSLDSIVDLDINENQYIALLSFAWNVGLGNLKKSTLLVLVNEAQWLLAGDEFLKWNKAGGRVINGLTTRRLKERDLFLTAINTQVRIQPAVQQDASSTFSIMDILKTLLGILKK